MTIIRPKQLREMNTNDLISKLSDLKLELMKEVGNTRMGKPTKNTGKIHELKRAIARIITIQKEKKKKNIGVKKK